jgi:hypothetical protein
MSNVTLPQTIGEMYYVMLDCQSGKFVYFDFSKFSNFDNFKYEHVAMSKFSPVSTPKEKHYIVAELQSFFETENVIDEGIVFQNLQGKIPKQGEKLAGTIPVLAWAESPSSFDALLKRAVDKHLFSKPVSGSVALLQEAISLVNDKKLLK